MWKISERDKRPEGYNLKEEDGRCRDSTTITTLRVRTHTHTHTCTRAHIPPESYLSLTVLCVVRQVPVFRPMDLMVEASPRRVFANAHTYHINSISVNSDNETYLSADDLRINLWHLEITDRSFSILHRAKVRLGQRVRARARV